MQKTRPEIIDFVVQHITNQGRAITETNFCLYYTPDGKRCAHSICVRDEILSEINPKYGTACKLIEAFGDEVHKPEFRGNNIQFWRDIQHLHDNDEFWNDKTLSKKGIKRVQTLKEYYD